MLEGLLVIAIIAGALAAAAFAMKRLSQAGGGCSPTCCCGDPRAAKTGPGPKGGCETSACSQEGASSSPDNNAAPRISSE